MNSFINMVRCSRTATYLKAVVAYYDHVKYYAKKRTQTLVLQGLPVPEMKFDDFPSLFRHCKGFNGTLGPSRAAALAIYEHIISKQQPFFDRFEGGIVGKVFSADHHHNVPSRIKVTDPFSGRQFSPVDGMHEIMNEKQQIVHHLWTKTTKADERRKAAEHVAKRLQDRGIDLNSLVIYLDKCCDDKSWLQGTGLECIRILIDIHHLITRYRDSACGLDSARYAQIMARISEIIVGAKWERIRDGSSVLADLDRFFEEVKAFESSIAASRRVITQNFINCHNTQKKHFRNCLTPPESWDPIIVDRFGHMNLKRGSGKNENGWRQKRAVFPEKCGFAFGHSLDTAHVAKWNFDQELQYDPRWAYLPISVTSIILTQHIALKGFDFLNERDGASMMFRILPLSLYDCQGEFGLTSGFSDACPAPVTIPADCQQFSHRSPQR